jgi:uncharacterized repeat protein (TIGR01451 family)
MHVPRLSSRSLPLVRSMRLWMALALLIGLVALLTTRPLVSAAAGSDISTSTISASPSTLAPGETATLTVALHNTGADAAVVDVSIPLAEALDYVAGSVTGGGTVTGNVVVWSGTHVEPSSTVALNLRVRSDGQNSAPLDVRVGAAIAGDSQRFVRFTIIKLTTSSTPAPPALATSDKTASKSTLAYGEKLTYSINLRNTGASGVVVSVSDPLPGRLDLVAGTITGGGSYNSATRTISWQQVNVPAGGSVTLSFQVTPNVHVIAPSQLTNTATITLGGVSFTRSATIALVMLPLPPEPGLRGSFKRASQHSLAPGQKMTFTINLHNSGTQDVTASVTDPLPAELSYVAGTASNGGVFSNGTLMWSNLTIPAGDDVALTFQVTPAGQVARRTVVINKATITSGDVTFERRGSVVLVPQPLNLPNRPPSVESLTIGDKDVVSSRDVTLHIVASADAAKMFIQEWSLDTTDLPRWKPVQSSGWVQYQSSYAWRLGAAGGTHFVGISVADAAGNLSPLTRRAVDFVSLVTPGTVLQGNAVPFLVYFGAGANVSATLKTLEGDADLYAWAPGHGALPDEASTQSGTDDDVVSFQTAQAGVYLFLVHGAQMSSYELSISPAGGSPSIAAGVRTAAAKPPVFSSEPVLSQAGLDPLNVALAPNPPGTIYLPVAAR